MATKEQPEILLTGATGTIGQLVVARLRGSGAPVRALVRDPARAGTVSGAGLQAVTGSYDDPESVRAALTNASTLFLLTPPHPKAAEWAGQMISAAADGGVNRIVRLSALKASETGPTENTRLHARTERELVESGLRFCILRPHFFMQNLLGTLPEVISKGTIALGMGDGRLGMVDLRDVADAVVRVLFDDGFDGAAYELTGPTAVDFHQVAREMARALGRPVRYEPISPEAAERAALGMGASPWHAALVRDYSAAYAGGWGDFTSGDLEKITGRAPCPVDQFMRQVLDPQSPEKESAGH